MPKNVKEAAITGRFKDGLLELTLPKVVKDIPAVREIPLKSASTNGSSTIIKDQPSLKSNGHSRSEEKAVLS
jgi:hypothetical protein